MTYYTMSELQAAARGMTASRAQESLRIASNTGETSFDVFLSHSLSDARAILGLRNLLTEQGMRVYVDWLDDPELDRSHVSPVTADRLRRRMQQSNSLIYATSRASRKSRWMPWELGYFDGIRAGSRVSILPVEDGSGPAIDGEEYLGLYKVIEKVRSNGRLRPYAVHPSRRRAEPLSSFTQGQGRFVDLVME